MRESRIRRFQTYLLPGVVFKVTRKFDENLPVDQKNVKPSMNIQYLLRPLTLPFFLFSSEKY